MQQGEIDQLRAIPVPAQAHWIAGRALAEQERPLAVVSPIDGTEITTIADGSARDVEIAVAVARSRFEDGAWSRAAPGDRKRRMLKLADLIEQHALELAVLGVRDNGTEINMAYKPSRSAPRKRSAIMRRRSTRSMARSRRRHPAWSGSFTMSPSASLG